MNHSVEEGRIKIQIPPKESFGQEPNKLNIKHPPSSSNIQHSVSSIILSSTISQGSQLPPFASPPLAARNDEPHSVLNDFTGFATAAFMAWKLTVISVITSAPIPETINIQNGIPVLYSYCFSHPFK